jgi:hypothetical protein
MTNQRANQRALAAARIVENLAYALPAYRDTLQDQLRHLTGFPDHMPGAAPPTVEATRPLEGKCTQPVNGSPWLAGQLAYELVDCGRSRPCAEHDRPVTLTPVERAAEQRQKLKADLEDAEQVISTITLLANDLLHRARRNAPIPPQPVPRCDATGLEGYLIPRPPQGDGWSDLACTRTRSRGTLCEACSQREYRWRTRHNMNPRSDGVMAYPAGTEQDVADYTRYGLRREA